MKLPKFTEFQKGMICLNTGNIIVEASLTDTSILSIVLRLALVPTMLLVFNLIEKKITKGCNA